MKAFITKYALTDGILEFEGEIAGDGMFRYRRSAEHYEEFAHGEGKDWHITRESAVSRALEMRIAKLKSLDKQISRISAIKF